MTQARRALLVLCFFASPLLFFTNLTRNPYVTQICLLNVSLLALAALAWLEPGASWPRTPLDAPLGAWVAVCALSWAVSYVGHRAFFRPPIAWEGLRSAVFLVSNVLAPFYLAAAAARRNPDSQPPRLEGWVALALVWGLLWTAFPQLRGPGAPAADIWGHVWDGYGALLWTGGLVSAWWLCRREKASDWIHLALLAGFLASAYGVCQYFNLEFIWPHTLDPYGGRSVSTFGNPNFLSSFNVILLPFAAALFLRAKGGRRLVYAVLALTLEAALLCSLTRSSWVGAIVALAVLAASSQTRAALSEQARPAGLLFGLGLLLALFWPQSLVGGYAPSVLGRIREMSAIVSPVAGAAPYSPWHQRRLIWLCAWLMGKENPITGKGFGCFELFYPFYQGPVLNALDFFRTMRTHANNAHNEILEVFSQTGLLGLGVFFWLWADFFRAAKTHFDRRDAWLPAAAVAGAAGMLVDNLLNVSLHFAVPAFLFWWAAGTAMGFSEPPAPQPEGARAGAARWPRALRPAALLLLAGIAGYWSCVWLREVHYFAGFKLVREGDLPAAQRELETSKRVGPPEVNAIYELGNSYARAQRFPEAVAAYRDALRANAGYDEIYFNIATIEGAHLGHWDAAVDNFRESWLINPVSPQIYDSLGNIYLRDPARYGDAALYLLERAVHFFPDNPNHWNNLGYLYSLRRRFADAERAYTQALMLAPNLVVAQRNLAALSRNLGHRPAVLSALDGLRDVEGRIARHDYSDATLALAGRTAGALPASARARLLLGSVLLARGRAADALAPLEWAVARDAADPWAHANLAEDYWALGRRADALGQMRAAVSLDPANSGLQQRLKILAGS